MDFLGGIGSIAGSIYAADQSKRSAREQMRFQERMSSTAHQREVSDLRKAGLNPILSATGGAGSSTPTGAAYEADPTMGGRAISSALEVDTAKQGIALQKAQEEQAASARDLNKAQAFKTRREAQILGPKAAIFEKALEGMNNNASGVSDFIFNLLDPTENVQKAIPRKPKHKQLGRENPTWDNGLFELPKGGRP